MPDLVTHSVAAYGAGARAERSTVTYLFLGTVLPDAASVVPALATERIAALAGLEAPAWVLDGFGLFHAPIPFALLAWLLALFWPHSKRVAWFVFVWLGGWLHIGLDFLQFHLAGPSYRPAYPFSRWAWEAGWIGTEASLGALPFLIPLGLGIWLWRRRQRR